MPPMLAQQDNPLLSFMLLAGVALIVLSLIMMLRKRRQRNATAPTAREQLEQSRQKQRMRGDLESLMVELEQLTKRFSAQLDTKTLQLEKLMDQADRRIEELKRLQGETTRPTRTTTASTTTTQDTESALRAASTGATPTATAPVSTDGGEDKLTRHVYALADDGLDAADIARQLDEHIGKIELMLALRKA